MKEATTVIAAIGFQQFIEFIAEGDPTRAANLEGKSVIEFAVGLFEIHPKTAIRVLNQIYKGGSDDRLSKISTPVLQAIDKYTSNDP